MNFFDKLNESVDRNQSLLCVALNPDPEIWPKHIGSWESISTSTWSIQEWLQLLIAETSDLVCAYKLTLELYRILGAPGLKLLSQTLAAIPADIPIILDAKHSDISTSTIFAQMAFSTWKVDAVTLNPYMGQDEVAPFLLYKDKAVFVLCSSMNPSAAVLQNYPRVDCPFYLNLVREAQGWGIPEQLGFEVGGNTETFARIRSAAPERIILADDVLMEGDNLEEILKAGLNSNGDGLMLSAPLDILGSDTPRESLRSLRNRVNTERAKIAQNNPACSVWVSNVCFLQKNPHKDLILQLYDIGCIQFGEFVQASGATFPYYIDLRGIISHPQVFEHVLMVYGEILKELTFDRIAGIPYGSLPTATGLGLRLNVPMIFPRKEVKAHGTRRVVEGKFQKGETVAVIDDILITGGSVMEGAEKLRAVGLIVNDIIVLIDHEHGVQEKLQEQGYQAHAVLTISEIANTLYEAGRLNE
jgi:uridine monophosphate synthetase